MATKCPKCESENIYEDGNLWICPECAHEWSQFATATQPQAELQPKADDGAVRDAHGNLLKDGDSVSVLKDLKVKGSSSTVKAGTKVKNIRLVDGHDGHDISCKIDGIGAMNLKSEFVKRPSTALLDMKPLAAPGFQKATGRLPIRSLHLDPSSQFCRRRA